MKTKRIIDLKNHASMIRNSVNWIKDSSTATIITHTILLINDLINIVDDQAKKLNKLEENISLENDNSLEENIVETTYD